MKAIIQNEFGSTDVLQYTDIEKPTITKENEVLIKVAYTSVNYADIKQRKGNKSKGTFPMILGLDISGTIEKVGTNSTFKIGDRVIAFPKNGTYAEYVIADEQLVFKIPENLSLKVAATIPTVSILSYMLLHEIGQIKPSDTIVIHSAAGGVRSALVQLSKLAGVQKVIATVGNIDKANYVKQLGADTVCTYDDFTDVVLEETNQLGANIIFDSVAGNVTTDSLKCLADYGTLVQFGNSGGTAGIIKTSDVHSSCRNIKGFSLGTTRKKQPWRLHPAAKQVIELFASNKLTLPIAKIFPLSETAQAHKLMESRDYQGKILINVGENYH
ncbi:quinone oxidoreductase family protein [Lysinibacillus endophyticus]|uniref:quinone oxidoreductase family protein n=1 Tax=Ureibacillus endophyticus TaxID=1978490 RepID=UPI00209F5B8A|nr:zinc-binding alcohol dehydrogenase family protein [Lysinibacillus endophyticus]MCP1146635.1 zinc-binding alcohol dehydrogenase family protein [Lysinibacillus endophyticus]